MSEKQDYIYISLEEAHTFDYSRIVITDPVTHTSKEGGHKWTTSDVFYIDDYDNKLPVYSELGEQQFWGIGGVWPSKGPDGKALTDADKTRDNIEGFQIAYPMTSQQTVNDPTPDEQAAIHIFDQGFDLLVEATKKYCEDVPKDKRKVPPPTYSGYLAGKAGDWSEAVKQPYAYQKTENKQTKEKEIDKSKPMIAYLKLLSYGEGTKIRCETDIYGPGDKKVSVWKFFGVFNEGVLPKAPRGKGTAAIHWHSVYWGSHGSTSSVGASMRYRIVKMNFTPIKSVSNIPKARLLKPNTSPIEESSEEEPDFPNPMGSNNGQQDDSNFKKGSAATNAANLLTGGLSKKPEQAKPDNTSGSHSHSEEGEKSEEQQPEVKPTKIVAVPNKKAAALAARNKKTTKKEGK